NRPVHGCLAGKPGRPTERGAAAPRHFSAPPCQAGGPVPHLLTDRAALGTASRRGLSDSHVVSGAGLRGAGPTPCVRLSRFVSGAGHSSSLTPDPLLPRTGQRNRVIPGRQAGPGTSCALAPGLPADFTERWRASSTMQTDTRTQRVAVLSAPPSRRVAAE